MPTANGFFPAIGEAVLSPLQELWLRFVLFLPALVGALIILLIGWIIAVGLDRIVVQVLKQLKLDSALNRFGAKTLFKKAGSDFELSEFIGALVKWSILLITFLAASDILGLDQVTTFLNRILIYVPNVFVAVFVLLLGFLAANFFAGVVRGTFGAARIRLANAMASATRWTIYIFSILVALQQLGVASGFINQFITALLFGIALAASLAFGLGGQRSAARWLDDMEKDFRHREK